ncbi:hypothetical protein Clacol_008817 [Clathrus columnatus]|uniref:Heme haloperoxidase family profile domain-containing protein n=1 Tax=Clathrus columnatus TaxID=1419009 RepID=A0AAV5AIS5_9AGAM|nr:hypothetical protein Clacol_008817 [Clathrus columnatus]
MPPLEKPRSLGLALRGRNTINFVSSKHSPDGHFEADEFRNWRLFNTPVDGYIRRRSKDQIDCMQNVEEEETNDGIHQWRPSKRHEARSPCPALNTAANHNYIPRHGRNLTAWCIIKGLRECYNISWGLAAMLTVGAFVILRWNGVGRGWINPTIDLDELAAHDVLEHNASLTRLDVDEIDLSTPFHRPTSVSTPPRSRSISSSSSTAVATNATSSSLFSFPWPFILNPSTYLYIPMMIISYLFSFIYHSSSISLPEPTTPSQTRKYPQASLRPNHSLIRALFADSASGTHFTLKDVARARIRRMETCPNPRVSRLLNHFADAELCISLAMFSPGKELKVDLESLREWFEEERLPRNWKPRKEIGVWENHQNTSRMQEMIKALKVYKSKSEKVRTVVFE